MPKIAKVKVLIIGPYPPPYSGPEIAIQMLLGSSLKDDFSLVFLSTNVRKRNAKKGQVGPVMILAFLVFMLKLSGNLIRHRPKVVYYFVTATKLGWLGRDVWCIALSRLLGAQVITHMRAGHFKARLENARSWEVGLIRWACHLVRWNLVQAPSLKDQFAGLAPDNRIAVCPNMIDTAKYEASPLEEHTPGNILFLGHISEAKGYNELLKVIGPISMIYPHVQFSFAGTKLKAERNVLHNQVTGDLLPNENPDALYEELIKGKYETYYNYLGVLGETEKINALKNCDFLVLPSYSEGFSMAVLEAMCIGKPVVVTAVGAMRDYVIPNENGELITPGDTEMLKVSIGKLLSDKTYRDRIAAHNAVYVRKNFSQATIAKRLSRYFKSVDQFDAEFSEDSA